MTYADRTTSPARASQFARAKSCAPISLRVLLRLSSKAKSLNLCVGRDFKRKSARLGTWFLRLGLISWTIPVACGGIIGRPGDDQQDQARQTETEQEYRQSSKFHSFPR
jgi:hypothetical protein